MRMHSAEGAHGKSGASWDTTIWHLQSTIFVYDPKRLRIMTPIPELFFLYCNALITTFTSNIPYFLSIMVQSISLWSLHITPYNFPLTVQIVYFSHRTYANLLLPHILCLFFTFLMYISNKMILQGVLFFKLSSTLYFVTLSSNH